MAIKPAPGEQYTIRRKIFKIFGSAFHVYDENNQIIGYCKQKAFKLKEDIRLFTGEDMSEELIILKARSIIDFGSTYDITLPDETNLGSLRRKGLKSSFIRDEWMMFDAEGTQIAIIREKNAVAAILRRVHEIFTLVMPQKYELVRTTDDKPIVELRQHFNPFVFRLGVKIMEEDAQLDELTILGTACLLAAIEGRQG
ncbi:MAG: hypothetical protein JKY96_06770 [Phycisphaerales bacterium]|nr:hypothetical protein [Phycisphaerales bacterium]